jgi:hypothetical protein
MFTAAEIGIKGLPGLPGKKIIKVFSEGWICA